MSDYIERMIGTAPCFICGQPFTFDVETVVSVWIDPQTNRPPDVNVFNERITPDPAAVERAVQRPICPEDVQTLRERGLKI